jgi:hypothetical protein
MSKKGHSVNALFDDDEYQQLVDLGKALNLTRGAVLRLLTTRAYSMVVEHRPACMSGQICFVPHLHASSAPVAPTPLAPQPQPQPAGEPS